MHPVACNMQDTDRGEAESARAEADAASAALSAATAEAASAREELRSYKSSSEALMEAKDAEVLALVRKYALLHEELQVRAKGVAGLGGKRRGGESADGGEGWGVACPRAQLCADR